MSGSGQITQEQLERRLEALRRNLGSGILGGLNNPEVIEVMLNQDGRVWFDVLGQGMKDSGYKLDAAQALAVIQSVASMLGEVVTADCPVVEGELPLDGSRFEGLIPPVVEAPVFAIRKKASKIFTLADYVKQGIMMERQAELLRGAVKNAQNVLVIGGTGSGKTTLLNALLHEMSVSCNHERLVVIEDTRELQCDPIKNKVMLRTSAAMGMTELLRATMRLRPDRIVVGEIRGKEGLALLKAWNSGHSGGCATIHADSVADGLAKLDEYVQEAGVPSKIKLIGRAVHFVVYIEKTLTGRKVSELGIVKGYSRELDEVIIEICVDRPGGSVDLLV